MQTAVEFASTIFSMNTETLMYLGATLVVANFVYSIVVEWPKTYAETNSALDILKTNHFQLYMDMRIQYLKHVMDVHPYSKKSPSSETIVALYTSPLFPPSCTQLLLHVYEDGGTPKQRTELVQALMAHVVESKSQIPDNE
jgi:hypothetical protein